MRFAELVDTDELQALCQSFTDATGIVTAILDLDGNILTATGWQEICTQFHRGCPETALRCRESDTILATQLREGQDYNVYRCQNGLIDVAVPLRVDGVHLANFFTGQFFFQSPDPEYFARQADQFGFDCGAYLAALAKVPVYSESEVRGVIEFFSRLARLMGEMGLARKRVEDANAQLRQYQEHLEELVQERGADLNRAQAIAHIGSWQWDIKTNLAVWSDEMYRVFGLTPGEPAQPNYETYESRVHPKDRGRVKACLFEAIHAKRPFSFEFCTVPIEGQERIVRVFGEVRCGPDGEAVEVFGADQDITEEKRVQQALAEAKEKAEAASRAKGAFLANMSHELRTPLNVIQGFSRLLQADPGVTPAQAESLDIIARSGEHLSDLVNAVLDVSKIEAGRMEREEVHFDLAQLVQTVSSLMGGQARDKGLAFSVEQALDLPRHVYADAGKLRQVLINLLGNAIKYTEHGGVVLHARVAARESPHQVRLRFEIVDSGIGIFPDEQTRLFEPFVQLANRPPGEPGTGLGLAICRQYVELMGGQVGLTSELGQGSRFHFEIPVAVTPADPMATAPVPGRIQGVAPGQPHYRVLIAEDDAENRLLLRQVLEPLGLELREAVNGQEAVLQCEQWQPHLIWMDIRMPMLDGREACRRIKARSPTGCPKIIALTAHALEEECREILAAGFDGLVRKPYRETEIFEALAKHLELQFLPASEDSPIADEDVPPDASELRRLPMAWLVELGQAVELLDGPRSSLAVDRIRQANDLLGQRLHRMVEGFHYKRLLAVLDEVTGRDQP